jgi:hypothetical protein
MTRPGSCHFYLGVCENCGRQHTVDNENALCLRPNGPFSRKLGPPSRDDVLRETAHRIIMEFRPNGWEAKEDEIFRLLQRTYERLDR